VARNLARHAEQGLEGIPATGRKATWTVIIVGRFEGEELAEDWVEYDRYNLFRQLGAL
jgi:predicted ester cyclase